MYNGLTPLLEGIADTSLSRCFLPFNCHFVTLRSVSFAFYGVIWASVNANDL